jgi:hypothetical protein
MYTIIHTYVTTAQFPRRAPKGRPAHRHPTAVAAQAHLLARIAKARLPKRRKPRPAERRAIRSFKINFDKLEGSRAEARQKLAAANAKS